MQTDASRGRLHHRRRLFEASNPNFGMRYQLRPLITSCLLTALWLSSASFAPAQSIYTPYTFVTYAGRPLHGSEDGPEASAQFDGPIGVASDNDGNLFIADSNNNTIRKITAAGLVSTLAGNVGVSGSTDGTGSAALFNGPQGVAVDANGNVYVSDTGNYSIRKITAAGVVTTFAGSPGVSGQVDGQGGLALFSNPQGVAIDSAGNIYVSDSGIGIRKITPAAVVTTLARALISGGVAVDTAGNVYAVAESSFSNAILKFSPSGSLTTLAVTPGPGGPIVSPFTPSGLAVDLDGNVYESDAGNDVILQITPDGAVKTLAGTAGMSGRADGVGGAARFNDPQGIAMNANGTVYVDDTGNNTVRKIVAGGNVSTLAGLIGGAGSSDGAGRSAQFNDPFGAAVDSQGNAYVADNGNNTIRKIAPGGVVTTLAGLAGYTGSTDGLGSAARFNSPRGVAVDGNGNVYVADADNETIRMINPAGLVTTLSGMANIAGSNDGTGGEARFNNPNGVAVDASGNVYVADSDNDTIRMITPAGRVTTLAGMPGTPGSADGPGTAARFNGPVGVAVDGAGNIYVSDELNDTIRKISPTGEVTTLAGTAGSAGSTDGVGGDGRFWYPFGIAVDPSGNVYVTDTNNYTVRKITPSGSVTTIGGTIGTMGSKDGLGATALFGPDSGIAVDGEGNVLVADNFGNDIRLGSAGVPTITSNPKGGIITSEGGLTLSVAVNGAFSYQWYLNGNAILGATSASYPATYGGLYTVVASNAAGASVGGPVVVAVANRLANISARVRVESGAGVAIGGFVISGPSGSTKQLLIRADGPSLSQFGLTGALIQPMLSVYDSAGNVIATNAGWGSAPVMGASTVNATIEGATSNMMQEAGAFSFPSGSADSAMVLTLPPGAYSAVVSGIGGTEGLALAEVYEINSSDSAVLSNISARADVGTGADISIGGFVVSGTMSATLLIRAVGPALSAFGVSAVLAQPVLSVFDTNGNLVATNFGWGSVPIAGNSTVNASIQAATSQLMESAGAFPVPANSSDSALVVALPPGSYSAEVSGAGGGTGIALVEIYQVR